MGYKKEIVVEAPIDKIWSAWTRREEAEKWLAPRANIQFQVGGQYEFFWNDDPELDSTLGCCLEAINKPHLLVFQWQGKSEYLHMFQYPAGEKTSVSVQFAAVEKGILVSVNQAETRNSANWAAYDTWMATAWEMALQSLKNHCEGKPQKPYWKE